MALREAGRVWEAHPAERQPPEQERQMYQQERQPHQSVLSLEPVCSGPGPAALALALVASACGPHRSTAARMSGTRQKSFRFFMPTCFFMPAYSCFRVCFPARQAGGTLAEQTPFAGKTNRV